MSGKFTIWLFVSAVMIIPISAFFVVNWYQNKFERLPILNTQSDEYVSFQLKNQNGIQVSNKDLEGKIVVTDFFFTHCPSICPKMTTNLKLIQEAAGNDSSILINSFSIDPERDSVGRLVEYASKFEVEGRWNLITGDKKTIYQLARKRFMVDATDGDGGPNDFIHSDKFVLLDQKGRIRGYYEGTDENQVKQLIADMKKLKEE